MAAIADELAEAVARATGQPSSVRRLTRRCRDTGAQARTRAGPVARIGTRLGTPADRYLIARDLPGLAASAALRFRGDTPHPEGGRLPALIALVS